MIAVIFELEPRPGMAARYFELAAQLRPLLDGIDGFVSVERFESVTRPGRYVSISFWRDEEAVRAWRTQDRHRAGQREGRDGILADYRLRVAAVVRDYGMHERREAPNDSNACLPL
ncbi:MAG: antibiotic biosynthesis monooxygenase [Proteobacteria bacterium]|nr:antibiotic biosynthesis monooxygenase [Pseudomonadota bacterium]